MIHAILTIDDIPSANTPAIVDYLNEKGIQAVMFMEGRRLPLYSEQAVYALRHGMIVGNHSENHPSFDRLTLEEAIREIETCDQRLDRLYESAGVERRYKPFRFPYGNKGGENKEALQRYLAEHGFHKLDDRQIPYPWWKESGLDRDIDTYWTFDFMEYRIRRDSDFTLEDVFKRIEDPHPGAGAALLKDPGRHILLLHAHDETEELAPKYYQLFIDRLLQGGVVFDRPEFLPAN